MGQNTVTERLAIFHVGLSSRSQRQGWFKQTFAEFDTEERKTAGMDLT